MKTKMRITAVSALITACLCVAALAQTETLQTHLAALKQSLTQNRQQLKQYQWTQTETVLYKGEEKSRKEFMAHYGSDGKVQKTEIAASPEKHPRGLRGHIEEKKKEELTADMKQAVDTVKLYVPPDPAKIEAARNAGKASIDLVEPQRIRLNFRDYEKPGDLLRIDIDPKTHKLVGANVSTYLNDPSDPVELVIQFGTLPDGTTYPSTTKLDVKAKNITVEQTNSNYTKLQSKK